MCVTSRLMRRLAFLLITVWMTSIAGAQPTSTRAAANQPAKSARVKAPAAKPAPRSVKSIAPVEAKQVVKPLSRSESAANALLTQYQRVGRDLMLLSNEWRAQIGLETEGARMSCEDLTATFRSIKLDDALKTAASRAETAALLAEVHERIQRLRRVALSQECLSNPLAKDCT